MPFIFLHMLDHVKSRFDIGGRIASTLRMSIFRKYMNVSAEVKKHISPEVFMRQVMEEA